MRGGLGETDEEEKAADEEHWMVIGENGPSEECNVDANDRIGHGAAKGLFFDGGWLVEIHSREFLSENEPKQNVRDDDRNGGLPAEVEEDVWHVPAPSAGNH